MGTQAHFEHTPAKQPPARAGEIRELPGVSVIIAAHNEEGVIADCLDALRTGASSAIQVIVSANGCTDRTVDVAAACGATVIDRAEPGKAAAINAAEPLVTSSTRIYLDADILVPTGGLDALVQALDSTPGAQAAVPRRRISTDGRPWPVRAYFAINERLPVFRSGLFGRGMIAVSAEGRARFEQFPTVIADDLFLDSMFADAEKTEAASVEVVVQAPRRTKDLVARLVRVRRGNAQMREAAAAGVLTAQVRPSDRWAWLRDVVARRPQLAAAAIAYVVITLVAARRAARADEVDWGHDASTRTTLPGAVHEVRGATT